MAKMPAFKLACSDGTTVASKDLKGAPYVLYAYPKDNTPGCTTESCDFRDNIARIQAKGVKLYGISPDSIASHEKFIAKFELPFPLLSDPDKAILTKLGAYGEKQMYGKTVMGVIRSTWLVGADGTILEEWRKVRVKGHVDKVLEAIDAHC